MEMAARRGDPYSFMQYSTCHFDDVLKNWTFSRFIGWTWKWSVRISAALALVSIGLASGSLRARRKVETSLLSS